APGALLEQAVALLQRPRIAAPERQEGRFHVEQAPIDVTPPRLAAAADQRVAARFEAHRGQRSAQIPQGCHRLAVQTALPGLPTVAQPRLAGAVRDLLLPLRVDLQCLGAGRHEAVAYTTAEAAGRGKPVHGLQHAGPACAVVAD